MASGGARGRSGPAPDPNAARRERKDDAGWTTLPAAGRPGAAPEWPLRGQSNREAELWESEWRRPQAIMWERNGQELEVALYIRRLTEAELPAAATNLGTLVRQMQEGLGLSIPGMLRNRWVIADGTTGPQAKTPTPGNVIPARDRFRAGASGAA
jgi:hypothetical protein